MDNKVHPDYNFANIFNGGFGLVTITFTTEGMVN